VAVWSLVREETSLSAADRGVERGHDGVMVTCRIPVENNASRR
jgi:hypothetical protein